MTEKRFTKQEVYDGINRYRINESNFIVEILDDGIPMHYSTIVNRLNEQDKTITRLEKENEQLKQQVTHLTMYKNLFREFQKQLDGVKKKSDLDHKDFEDLIELTKGHVFDDEHGWIWLPVNDR